MLHNDQYIHLEFVCISLDFSHLIIPELVAN